MFWVSLCKWVYFGLLIVIFISAVKLRQRRNRQGLKLTDNPYRTSSCCQLVSRMVDIRPGVTGATSERGLVGLLNTPTIVSCLNAIQFNRDKDTSLLSPAKSQRY